MRIHFKAFFIIGNLFFIQIICSMDHNDFLNIKNTMKKIFGTHNTSKEKKESECDKIEKYADKFESLSSKSSMINSNNLLNDIIKTVYEEDIDLATYINVLSEINQDEFIYVAKHTISDEYKHRFDLIWNNPKESYNLSRNNMINIFDFYNKDKENGKSIILAFKNLYEFSQDFELYQDIEYSINSFSYKLTNLAYQLDMNSEFMDILESKIQNIDKIRYKSDKNYMDKINKLDSLRFFFRHVQNFRDIIYKTLKNILWLTEYTSLRNEYSLNPLEETKEEINRLMRRTPTYEGTIKIKEIKNFIEKEEDLMKKMIPHPYKIRILDFYISNYKQTGK